MIIKTDALIDSLKCLLIYTIACLPGASSKIHNLQLTPELSACYTRFHNVTLNRVVGKFLMWHCESSLTNSISLLRLSYPQRRYFYNLAQRLNGVGYRRGKRQARRCVRREYRVLNRQEREDFHRAVNGLKGNRSVQPSVYDALAMLHSEMQILKAHGGPCFLGWHRVFILMFEMALGDEVPGVCLPYWDSSLDSELPDPSQSYMFSPELMGNGNGPITTGPFAGWRRPPDPSSPNSRQPPVLRNVGVDGQLYSRQSVEMILSRNDHSEIIAPNTDPDYDIEVQHGGVHLFIGGDMESLVTSPNDPIFFMHHAFVDYIWELFRMKLRNQLNIDPSRNYPTNHNIQFHSPNEMMDIANLTCGDGYSEQLMNSVVYEASPSCSGQRPTCNSPYLRCQANTGRCIPLTLQEVPRQETPGFGNPGRGNPGLGNPGRPGFGNQGSGLVDPRFGQVNPGAGLVDPRFGQVNPGAGLGDPRFGQVNPGAGLANPGFRIGNPGPGLGNQRFHPGIQDPAMLNLQRGSANPSQIWQHHRTGRSIHSPATQCSGIKRVKPCQNSFCINGVCDISQWVYVPVRVITIRPPGLKSYRSYPVINGDISTLGDIYFPNDHTRTQQAVYNRLSKTPKGYSHCQENGIGKIFVQSQGLNYEGLYKDFSIIDQRLSTTMSIAYVAIKDPGHGASRAILRATDACGRICHTACRNERTGEFESCSGVIEVDSRAPQMYSQTLGDATLDVWDYELGVGKSKDCPRFKNDKFFLTFYCDYPEYLPWVDRTKVAASRNGFRAVPGQRPVYYPQQCQVGATCVLDVPCYSAKLQCRTHGETHRCRRRCGHFAVCVYGHYKERVCPGGMAYGARSKRCSATPCRKKGGAGLVHLASWDTVLSRDLALRYMKNPIIRVRGSVFAGKR